MSKLASIKESIMVSDKRTYVESDSALHCKKNPKLFWLYLSALWLVLCMAMIFLLNDGVKSGKFGKQPCFFHF